MIDWHEIDTILLDMDGTLLDLHFDNFFWFDHLPLRYAEAHGMSVEAAKDWLGHRIRQYEGTLQWYCLDHWSELTQLDIPALKQEISEKIQLRPHTENFLRRLKALDKKLILITNAHRAGLDIKLDVTRIDRWLDIIISSHDYQTPKEEQAFWHQLMEQESFDKQRTLFIDDTPKILRSAGRFGIKQLVCITSPDSKKPEKDAEEFMGIQHFDEIMPSTDGSLSMEVSKPI